VFNRYIENVHTEWLSNTPMNELQRQAYLRVMGIEAVYPRLPVTAARPSPVYDLPALPSVDTSAPSVAPVPPATRSEASARARVVSELAATEADSRSRRQVPESEPAPSTVTPGRPDLAAAQSEGDAALRFRLHYLPVNASLAVLWEVPLHGASEGERESRVLLNNILLALAAPLPSEAPALETFDWPILDAATEQQPTARQAGQAVEGFVAMRRRRDGFSNLLVFASQVAAILPGQGEQSEQRLDKLNCHLVCVSSLQTMLSVPVVKKDVWQQLQPLRQRLVASNK